MRIIAIIIPLMWGTVIFGHGKEKHEPKIIDDHKIDNTSQKLIPDEGERLKFVNDKENNTKTNPSGKQLPVEVLLLLETTTAISTYSKSSKTPPS